MATSFFEKIRDVRSSAFLRLYLWLAALEALAAVLYLLSIPADPKNSVLLGFSAPRLAVTGAMLALFCGLALLAGRSRKLAPAINAALDQKALFWGVFAASLVLFFGGWTVVFTPLYRFEALGPYIERLLPVILWAALAGGQTALPLLARRYGLHCEQLKAALVSQKTLLRLGLLTLAGFLAVWLFMAVTKIGVIADPIHYNETGIPILGIQILLAWAAGVAVWLVEKKLAARGEKSLRLLDRLLPLLIWLAAAVIWNLKPFPGNYLAPGPYPPNYVHYPFSDAAGYDITAQFALIGQGLNNMKFVDKPLYSTFLILLNLLGGQRHEWIIPMQVTALAVLPALLYLLGKALHSRAGGVVVAGLAIFKETNAIETAWMVLSSNTRLMMSEVPTAIGIAVFLYWMVRWLQDDRRRLLYPALAGGTLGLTVLIRHNPWALLPVGLLALLVGGGRRWRRSLLSAGLLAAMMAVSSAPWMWRSAEVYETPLYVIYPLRGSVYQHRYGRVDPQPVAQPAEALQGEEPPEAAPPEKKTLAWRIQNVAGFASIHFFNNLRSAALILPTWLSNDDLLRILRPPVGVTLWSIDWDGSLTPLAGFLLFVNLALAALGVGSAWARWRLAGLMPLIVFGAYMAANALARTSGGRYIIPVDWIVYFYFGLGLVQLSGWLGSLFGWDTARFAPSIAGQQQNPPVKGRSRVWVWGMIIPLGFLLLGATTVLLERAFPPRYPARSQAGLAAEVLPLEKLTGAGISAGELESFLAGRTARLYLGRALYPRYYGIDQGETDRFSHYGVRQYPRLALTLIGAHGNTGVILPLMEAPAYLPNGSDVIALGCQGEDDHLDALLLVVLQPDETILLRSPSAALTCPLPEPVCENSQSCK